MGIIINKSNKRGFSDYGWLKVWHSFSFGEYFNPLREKFGVIRVLNEELLSPLSSLEMHEYRDLEIMLFPLDGSIQLEAPDRINKELTVGDVALISAGSGLKYALHNLSAEKPAGLLQVWFFPRIKNVEPSLKLFINKDKNQQEIIIDPFDKPKSLNQDVWVKQIRLKKDEELIHNLQNATNKVLAFVIEGEVIIKGEEETPAAGRRDTIEITEAGQPLILSAVQDSDMLIIETIPD